MLKNKLVIGTANWGLPYGIGPSSRRINTNELKKIILILKKNQIFDLDTSVLYGDAHSRILDLCDSNFRIYTKFSANLASSNVEVFKSTSTKVIDNILSKFEKKNLKGLYIHNVDAIYNDKFSILVDLLKEVQSLKKDVKTGVSVYSASDVNTLLRSWTPDIIQVPLNIIDQRMVKSQTLAHLKDHGVEIHARSVFLQGILLMDKDKLPKSLDILRNAIDKIDLWCRSNKVKKIDACLSYVEHLSEVDKIVLGVENCDQLNQVLAADMGSYPTLRDIVKTSDEKLLDPRNWS